MIPQGSWPEAELEWLGKCPACGAAPRDEMFGALRDEAFQVAPGRWTLWRCKGCEAAYLDPRPDEASIGRAYANYYTHTKPGSAVSARRMRIKLRLQLGYYNKRYGYDFAAGWAWGALVYKFNPLKARRADYAIRHLPAPPRAGAALLDVGCGNGSFLLTARDLGYAAVGLEPDEDAVHRARDAGLDVRQGLLPDSGLPEASFDHVFLNHVFEHLHKPRAAADEILRLLRPGGRVWLSQPNLGAIGLEVFGASWRGLETPRHLSLYTRQSLARLLSEAGFEAVEMLPAEAAADFYFQQSLSMRQGLNPQTTRTPPGWNAKWREQARAADETARRMPERGESLTMVARKPV
jgi:2-polyprenyl-3-methyl-5-hydroxy-6-metoxy-1,4-benzoquinol methylase